MPRGYLPLLFLSFCGAALTQPAVAQPQAHQAIGIADPDSGPTIVVTAEPDPEPRHDVVRRQARSITVSGSSFHEPLALFQEPVCPGVAGLPVELAMLVADRIRFNAERAGLRLGTGGECDANLIVAFVKDGAAYLNGLSERKGTILARLPLDERRALLNEDGPVRAWTVTSLRTRDGVRPTFDHRTQVHTLSTHSAHSLFLLAHRIDIEMSVVIIDIAAIDGMSAVQLADYATMRGLARTRPVQGDASYATILNLFDPDSAHPLELTTFDLAYLKTLYSNVPNIAAAAKLGGVKSAMNKELIRAQAD